MSTVLPVPQSRPRSITQLAILLSRTNRSFVVVDVRNAPNRCHARLMESEFLLRGKLNHYQVAKFTQNGSVRSGRMNQMAGLAGIFFQAVNLRSDLKGSQWISVSLIGTYWKINEQINLILCTWDICGQYTFNLVTCDSQYDQTISKIS